MDGGDPAMPTSKRPRLDSANTAYIAGHPPPPTTQPAHSSAQSSRHSSLSTPVHPSPPPNRHYPPPPPPPPPHHPHPPPPPHSRPPHQPYSLPAPPPPPPPQYPQHHQPQQQQQQQHQSPSHPQLPHPSKLPPPNPSHRINGLSGTPVTHSVRVSQDNIDTYRPSPTPQPTSAPEPPPSRAHSVHEDPRMANTNPSSPWHANSDPRNGHPIPNGYHTMSPPNQVEQPFQAPPTQPGQHYAPPPPVGGYNPSSYMSPQYASGSAQVRRKQVRATQACNHCRSRKQKCDEARPCQFCRENNFDCQYKDVPVPKQDRTMMQLQEGQNEIAATLKSFIDSFNVWKQNIETRLPPTNGSDGLTMSMEQPSPSNTFDARGSMSERRTSQMPTPVQPRSQLSRVNSMKTESPNAMNSHISPVPTTASTPIKQEAPAPTFQPPPTPVGSVHRSQSAGDNPEGLQSDHTTPAHMLLPRLAAQWNLDQRIPELKWLTDIGKLITDYPLHYEQDRGLLRVWGVGEGHDLQDGVQGVASPASHYDSEAASPATQPQRESSVYGPPVDQSSPSTVSGDTIQDSVGGLGPDGRPDFRQATLKKLHKEYENHIHVLHPFMNPYQLEKMITEFGAVYSPEARATQTTMSPAAVERLHPTGVKRKRSNSIYLENQELYPKGYVAKSLRNGIVLLVLALGKVCEYKGPLPSPHSDRNPLGNGAGSFYRDSPRSYNGSFHSDDGDARQRNLDIIPGMAYFSLATDIMGNNTAGNTVAHAQANLLAALYIAQFARVMESWSWISNACRIALVLIKADYTYINRDLLLRNEQGQTPATAPSPLPTVPRKDRHRLNLVKVIYYTCLQLETDILAELSTLPPTGGACAGL
ncbi:unnamed protein product [Periconia digitata]|uniref:Zn(2)-C6 fungal-type domain-containing protein n=1 Tax=Periconia digitata TaxID=1303443 RepID=A0A9W4UI55_9PLEO|nr:unnamed protein product [Periconia digitata]